MNKTWKRVVFACILALLANWAWHNFVTLRSGEGNVSDVSALKIQKQTEEKTDKYWTWKKVYPKVGVSQIDEEIKKYADGRVKMFEDGTSEGELTPPIRDMGMKMELIMSYTTEQFGPYLSVVFTNYEFSGGAHGNYDLQSFVYDLRTNKTIKLSSLFRPSGDYLGVLQTITKKDVRAQLIKAGMTVNDIFEEGFEPKEENYSVFSLGKNGLTIYFGPYQVAPWAAGLPKSLIKYSDLADYLSETAQSDLH